MSIRTTAALCTALSALPGLAAAQDIAAFTQAAASPVAYTVAPVQPALACAALRTVAPGDLTVLSATEVAATPAVPAHCQVDGLIAPEIRFQYNFPDHWNRRFYMFGNGGYAGETAETAPKPLYRAHALAAGFATAWTNTGHDARREPLASFATSQQKVVDYAFRAVHLTAVVGKGMAARYYGRPAATAYWDGCSTGGRQGLMEAQRFPADFDGVLAGAPVERFVDSQIAGLWNGRAVMGSGLTLDKLKTASAAVYAKCADPSGVIVDPRQCRFDYATDVKQCTAGVDDGSCLTPRQASAITQVYSGVVSQGKPAFFGYMPGSETPGANFTGIGHVESGWDEWLLGRNGAPSRQQAYGEAFVRALAYPAAAPGVDSASFNFDTGLAGMTEIRGLLDADDPNLSAFHRRGGKLILYHGWADTALTPLMSIDYLDRATRAAGDSAPDFLRLYMVPGMFHCGGGLGTDRFDAMTALIRWVENGEAPGEIPASRLAHGVVDRTRPLCPYPQNALYDGKGDVNAAASYACAAP